MNNTDIAAHMALVKKWHDDVLSPWEDQSWEAVEASARQLAEQPGFVMVPVEFMRGFHTLAHNWSLEAIPPDYLWGTEKDVFKSTYRRCGHDLAKLKDLLAAAPTEENRVIPTHNKE